MNTHHQGIALPITMVFLAVFAILTLALVSRFSSVGAKEFAGLATQAHYYALAQSGIEQARYLLQRPDDPSQAHRWTANYSTAAALDVQGKRVNVQIADVRRNVGVSYPGNFFTGVFATPMTNAQNTTHLDVGDFDGDGVQNSEETLPVNGARKLFYLSHRPIHQLVEIKKNGATMPRTEYAWEQRNGWVSFKNVFSSTNTIKVSYKWSADVDMVLTVTNQDPYFVRNNGDFAFSPVSIPLPGARLLQGDALADLEGDGDLDLAALNENGFLTVYRNNGSGSFGSPIVVEASSSSATNIIWGDFTNDGNNDIFALGGAGPSSLFVYDGAESFIKVWSRLVATVSQDSRPVDFDGDGDLDIAFGNVSSVVVWRNNLSNGPFLYAADKGNDRVVRLRASDLGIVDTFSSPAVAFSIMMGLVGVALDATDVVSSTSTLAILSFNNGPDIQTVNIADKSMVGMGGSYDDVANPQSIASDGTSLYVADTDNGRVRKLNAATLAVEATYAGVNPRGVDVQAGLVYITDSDNVSVLDATNLAPVTVGLVGGLNDPRGVVFSPAGFIYVCERGTERVLKFTAAGVLVDEVGGPGNGQDEFTGVSDLAIVDGFLYVSDEGNNRIQKRNLDTLDWVAETAAGSLSQPVGLGGCTAVEPPVAMEGPVYTHYHFGPGGSSLFMWIESADTDNDGDLDLVATHNNIFPVLPHPIFRNDGIDGLGNPILTEVRAIDTQSHFTLAIGDVDKNGTLDVIAPTLWGNPSVRLCLNEPSGFPVSWTTAEDPQPSIYNILTPGMARFADFDNDGWLDFAAAQTYIDASTPNWGPIVFENTTDVTRQKFTEVISTYDGLAADLRISILFKVDPTGLLGPVYSAEIH